MGSIETMTLLGQSFIDLAEYLPIEKISVSDIVAASGKNRKTFYYHFESKDSLIRWIFRRDLAEQLAARAEADTLVYEKDGPGAFAQLPYYVQKKSGVRSLDGTVFLESLAACFQGRRSYYAKVLRQSGPDSLQAYLRRLYTQALQDDVLFILSNRYLPQANVHFLAEFYAGAIVTYLAERTCDASCSDILVEAGPFGNVVHASLESVIKDQQLKRGL